MIRPAVLPFAPPRPDPLLTLVCHLENDAGWTTAIARVWPAGTGCCGRCPLARCTAHEGHCLVAVNAFVSVELAPGLSLVDAAWAADDDLRSGGDVPA